MLAAAEPVAPGEPATPLAVGEPAPFAGVLLGEAELAALLKAQLEQTELRIRMRILQTENETLEGLYHEKTREGLPKWYDQPQVRFVAGFATGAFVATAIAITVSAARVLAHE
jgi:hypothetical protein